MALNGHGRTAVEAYRALGAAAGFMSTTDRDTGGQAAPALQLNLSQEAVDGLLKLVQAYYQAAGDDGG
jgi:hypothetical protein